MSTTPKYHTVIFVPHAKARFRKFRVSDRQLRFGAVAAVVAFLLALSSSVSFVAGIRSSSESARLRQENRRLRDANQRYSDSISGLRTRLDNFELQTKRLAILAGLSDSRELARGGAGGPHLPAGTGDAEIQPDSTASIIALRGESLGVASRLSAIERLFRERLTVLASTPTIAPVVGIPTNGFGTRTDPFEGGPEYHPALDIASSVGSPVVSPAGGVVVRAGWENGYGNLVEVSHGFGYVTRYGHLSRIDVKAGATVARGDRLGLVGTTGRSTGPHLHYEIVVDGRHVNPLEYILDAF